MSDLYVCKGHSSRRATFVIIVAGWNCAHSSWFPRFRCELVTLLVWSMYFKRRLMPPADASFECGRFTLSKPTHVGNRTAQNLIRINSGRERERENTILMIFRIHHILFIAASGWDYMRCTLDTRETRPKLIFSLVTSSSAPHPPTTNSISCNKFIINFCYSFAIKNWGVRVWCRWPESTWSVPHKENKTA